MSFGSRAGTTREQNVASTNAPLSGSAHKTERNISSAWPEAASGKRHKSPDSTFPTKRSNEPLENTATQHGSRKRRKIVGENYAREQDQRHGEVNPLDTFVSQDWNQKSTSASVQVRGNAEANQSKISCNLPPRPSFGTPSSLSISRRPQGAEADKSANVDSASSRLNAGGLGSKTSIKTTSVPLRPWKGDHPEDVLSEQVIQHGYTAKPQVPQETNSARHSLWPHLKHASALDNLSSVFTAVLKSQREDGQVVTNSTFKPPPRVTLTDARKTAWLQDLAKDSVPLRRLSRTIPHGVRGVALLQQCVANKIPCSRAVWLTKCVGANELRASKRKGVSVSVTTNSELRWVTEWTETVETFLTGIVTQCQKPQETSYSYGEKNLANIIALLDKVVDSDNIEDSFQLSSWSAGNLNELVTTVMMWAISDYRTTLVRPPIAAKFLGQLRFSGVDINENILNFLTSVECTHFSQLDRLSKLLTRLAKDKHFDVAAYFRWLIATGSLEGCDPQKIKLSPRARFLQDVPAQEISGSLAALRRQLLRRARCLSEDVDRLENIKYAIHRCLPGLFLPSSRRHNGEFVSLKSLSSLNSYDSSEIKRWLHPMVKPAAWSFVDGESTQDSERDSTAPTTSSQISTLLYIYESLDDYEALSALMLSTLQIAQFDLLLMIIDTTTLHLQVFKCLGVLEALQNSCVERYRGLRRLYPAQKSLIHSLHALIGCKRDDQNLSKYLQAELTSCEQTCAAAACTPASEGILNESQGTPAEKDDEFERILANGASMDGPMISKIFEASTERILGTAREKDNTDSITQQSSFLSRLQIYDEARFELLIVSWIERVAASKQSSDLLSIAPFLAGSDCIDLFQLITHAKKLFTSNRSSSQGPTSFFLWLLEVFTLDLSNTCPLTGSDRLLGDYRERVDNSARHFMVKQSSALAEHSMDLVDIMCAFLNSVKSEDVTNSRSRIRKVFASDKVLQIIMKAILKAPVDTYWKFHGAMASSETKAVNTELELLVRRMMDPSGSLSLLPFDLPPCAPVLTCLALNHKSYGEAFTTIFTNVDNLSEPLLRVGLSLLVQSACLDGDTDSTKEQLSVAVRIAIDRGCRYWKSLLSLLPGDVSPALEIRKHSEQMLLQDPAHFEETSESFYKKHLNIVANLKSSISPTNTSIVTDIVDKFKTAAERLLNFQGASDTGQRRLQSHLEALLRLAVIHEAPVRSSQGESSHRAKLLIILSRFVLKLPSRDSASLRKLAFHGLIFFSLDIDDSTKEGVAKQLSNSNDGSDMINFLFDSQDSSTDSWMRLESTTSSSKDNRSQSQSRPDMKIDDLASTSVTKTEAFPLRKWELLPDAAPNPNTNDTALSLKLFAARKV
ncbi:MAG: RNA polymerase II mediator complex subunit [Alyxoria varia]|nr:MAG: RNA polymerase II mediator complex subunit [Alyxoria varia]